MGGGDEEAAAEKRKVGDERMEEGRMAGLGKVGGQATIYRQVF